jgi:hypothetical protein
LAKVPSPSSSPRSKTEEGAGTVRRPAKGGAPAALPMAAAGIGLKRERRPRGSRSRAHLVLGRSEGAAPRRAESGGGATGGGGAVGLGEEGRKRYEVVVVWCGEPGRPSAPFIGGERRFGKGDIFRRGQLRRARAASRGLGRVNLCRDLAGD